MTKPTDDLEAVRAVTEALQGFDAQDQERILRWAREKLDLVATPDAPLPKPIAPIPSANTFDLASLPAATPPNRNLEPVERLAPQLVQRPAPQVPVVEPREAQPPAAWQPEVPPVEVYEVEQPAAQLPQREQPAEPPPEAVNLLMPEPEQKSRLPMLIGIIALTIAVAFLILMIVSSHTK